MKKGKMDPHLSVSVAIVTWNRKDQLLEAVESAYGQSYRPHEIVVVDSNSRDGTAESLEMRFPSVRVIRLHRNLGCPEGRNIAFANCSGDIIISLDDDARLHPDAIHRVVDTFRENDSNIGVVTFNILDPDEATLINDGDIKFVRLFNGGACGIQRSALLDTGYFRHDFFRQGEEGELSLRLFDRGYRIVYNPNAIAYHRSTRIDSELKNNIYFECRNQLYTLILRYPASVIVPFFIKSFFFHFRLGLKYRALFSVVKAWFSASWELASLLKQRDAISLKSFKEYRSYDKYS